MRTRQSRHPEISSIIIIVGIIFLLTPLFLSASQTSVIYNVLDYGAIGDGQTNSTVAIQKAIDACSMAGGGTVLIPPGRYLTGSIQLKDFVTLELKGNAFLLGSMKLEDYPLNYHIYAKNARQFRLTGNGIVDSQGEIFWRGKDRPYQRPNGQILFENCTDARVDGITLLNSPNWAFTLTECEWVYIDGIKMINSLEAPNTDGIDPCSSRNVFISNCYIETGDDAICLKSNRGKQPVENIVVTNCVLITDDTAIKCGTGSNEKIQHCVFSNIVIRGSKYGIGFYMKDGGVFEDLTFSNITMETLRYDANSGNHYPIFLDIEPRTEKSPLGKIRNLTFRDILITTYGGNCLIQGRAEQWAEDLVFDNVRMRVMSRPDLSRRSKPRGTRTLTERAPNDFSGVSSHMTFGYIRGLRLSHVAIRDEAAEEKFPRHAIWGQDLKNVVIEDLDVMQNASMQDLPVLFLKNVDDAVIQETRTIPQGRPFLKIEGERTNRILLDDNRVQDARKSTLIGKEVKKEAVKWE